MGNSGQPVQGSLEATSLDDAFVELVQIEVVGGDYLVKRLHQVLGCPTRQPGIGEAEDEVSQLVSSGKDDDFIKVFSVGYVLKHNLNPRLLLELWRKLVAYEVFGGGGALLVLDRYGLLRCRCSSFRRT